VVKEKKELTRKRRHLRVRRKVSGTPDRPRLNVYRSLKHIYAQVIDDTRGHTLVSISTLEPAVREQLTGITGKAEAARKVGEILAQKALDTGVKEVVFDRGGFLYHGRVKALADGARSQGLIF